MNIAHALSSTRLTWMVGAVFAMLIAVLAFYPPPPIFAQSASLTTTVNSDRSVDLDLSNGPSSWWFRINSWGTCTAASGTSFDNIRGYAAGTHSVNAYSDSSCASQIASSSFTIPSATLAATVNGDRSVDLTLTGGPNNWWFRINSWGTCTAASGTGFSNIRGYQSGTYNVGAYSDGGCSFHIASSSFTIPSATLAATVNGDRSVDLTLTGGPGNWWFRIGSGTCTAATGTTFSNIRGYGVGTHSVGAYSDGGCGYHIASSSFTIAPLPPSSPPPAPALITLERVCDHKFTVRWTASVGATGYDLNYSTNNRKSWKRAKSNVSSTVFEGYAWNKNKTYWMAVRARNANGESGWTNSAAAPAPPCAVGNLRAVTSTTHGTAGGSITTTWDAGKRANAYNVNYRADGGEWQRIATDHTTTSHTGTVTATGSHTVAVQSLNGSMGSRWSNFDVAWLTAGGIGGKWATLTLAGHGAQWWYKANTGPHATCQGPVAANTNSTSLTGVSAMKTYTYSAYRASGCDDANLLATAEFTTDGVSVSNLSEASDGSGIDILRTNYEATGFTTGDHDSGYKLDRVVIKFRNSGNSHNPGVLTAAIHAESSGSPAASATYTLSGSSTPLTAGDYTYTCSGTCSLDKDTTYFLVLSGTGQYHSYGYYTADSTQSDSETNTPSDAGWSIANRAKYKSGNEWEDETSDFSLMFEVVATEK